ncbi:Transcription factor rbf1 (RPG-box-binding factor) (Repressor-activator protein 1) [Kalmusia sp. IMI 367209]|nr:Transcription factor rbf1 (RPG-box-binding factor) (Repressor-activator protein 1) [Kalmusia sp. IMI 367209]
MRPALHSHSAHSIPEDPYNSLPHELATAASSYPAFVHHGDPITDHTTSFGVSSPAEHHHTLPSQHAHIEHSSLHLDPNLSPEESREFQPSPLRHAPTTPSTHPTWQALHSYAQSHASAHGYALSINTTAKNRSRIKLACVCYGAPKNTHKLTPETRVRKNRVSYKTGCKMWVDGKKEDGSWVLRGRVGVGGVTALEEREQQRLSIDQGQPSQEEDTQQDESVEMLLPNKKGGKHSLESGGPVWKIVEQEMLRKGMAGPGRDRGVGRTVQILKERLPGIHIFKRDVYNIRAQIKRARKAAGQELGEGLVSDSEPGSDVDESPRPPLHTHSHPEQPTHASSTPQGDTQERGFSQVDPSLIAQCNSALENIPLAEDSELDTLRQEVDDLRRALAQKTKETEEKHAENESLRVQLELANMALYNERGPSTQ